MTCLPVVTTAKKEGDSYRLEVALIKLRVYLATTFHQVQRRDSRVRQSLCLRYQPQHRSIRWEFMTHTGKKAAKGTSGVVLRRE